MTSFEPVRRAIQPAEPLMNSEFVEGYLSQSSATTNDGRVPDDDATFFRLLQTFLNAVAPRAVVTDATIRITKPWHAAIPAVVVRHFVEFTVLLGYCQVLHKCDPQRTAILGVWWIGACLVFAVIKELARQDPTLFFRKLEPPITLLAAVALFLFVLDQSLVEALVWTIAGYILAALLIFPTGFEIGSPLRRAARLATAVGLVNMFPEIGTAAGNNFAVPGCLFFIVNFVLLLPIPFSLQHWFAAQRYATLADVRSYGPDAPIFHGNWSAVLMGACALIAAAMVSFANALMLWRVSSCFAPGIEPTQQSRAVLLWISIVILFSGLNFLLYVWGYNRRGRLYEWSDMIYATWRALAVWLSQDPPLTIPTVFQFQRPWSVRCVRVGLISASLCLNSAITLMVVEPFISSFVTAKYFPVAEIHLDTQRPSSDSSGSQQDRTYIDPNDDPDNPDYHPTARFRRYAQYRNEQQKATDPNADSQNSRPQFQGLPGKPPQPKAQTVDSSPPIPIPLWTRLSFALVLLLLVVLLPPAILFLMLNAAWGPVFLAYSQRFEQFNDHVQPPVLCVSLRATRRRWRSQS